MSIMSSELSFLECRTKPWNPADVVYFALGSHAERSWPNLSWVAQNFEGHKICFIHVLQPNKVIASENAPRDNEKQYIQVILQKFHILLRDAGVKFRILGVGGDTFLKMEKVEEGIVMLISHLKIKNLVMGAAASREMVYFKSKISGYVSEKAPASCQIWFVRCGHLIKTRYDQISIGVRSKKETHDKSLRHEEKESMEEAHKEPEDATTVHTFPSLWSEIFGNSSSHSSVTKLPSYNSSCAPTAPPAVDLLHDAESEDEIEMPAISRPQDTISNSSPSTVLNEGTAYDKLYEQLEHTMAELHSSKKEAFEESSKRQKAEKCAVEASRRVNTLMEEQNMLLREKLLLEDAIADFQKDNKELTDKIVLSVEMMKSYKYKLDECKAEQDRALRAAEKKHSAKSTMSSSGLPQLLSEFSYSEIEDATLHFDTSLIIEERGHWRIFKGVLCHTEVSIKLLDSDISEGHSKYRQEVESLSIIRHPNIVTLIGACPEALAIIYEHLPNGSLEDRLNCTNSSPLPWQIRICIAAELCSVLVFLHSNKSHCIVHGDLKPANILLDANFSVKLSHFGLSRTVTIAGQSNPKSDVNRLSKFLSIMLTQGRAKPSDTFVYMDPESIINKEYTPELDVYSFGIILLRLLTGRAAWGITNKVQLALDNGNLDFMLDSLAGDWPFVQAQQLAKIALRCSDVSRKNRPDLESTVLGVLQKMKAACQGSPIGYLRVGELYSQSQPPPYYICPISQDVMQDPHMAADGFTYEKEGIQGWLNSGHNTSPMTNLKLENMKLVPNRALRSAIQEWKQHP